VENDYIITFGDYNKTMIDIAIKDFIEFLKEKNQYNKKEE
jgi:hypothetical protein